MPYGTFVGAGTGVTALLAGGHLWLVLVVASLVTSAALLVRLRFRRGHGPR